MALDKPASSAAVKGADARLRISIVTPNFNGAAFIDETLKSVVSQNYPNLDFIVVDGASKDASLSIIRKYESHISTLIVEPDKGHADALNKGFAAATGEILGWINSDDILLPGALSFIDRLFRARPDIEWITGRPSSMDEAGKIGWIGPLRAWSRLRFLSGDNKWIQQESTFWRRSLWRRAGGELDLRYSVANDFDLWRRFFRHAELHAVDRHLGCFRIRGGQRSTIFRSRYEDEIRSILDEELNGLEPDFRSAFSELLPTSADRLRSVTEIADDKRFAICDPPVVRPGEAFGWSIKSDIPTVAAGVAMPIWQAAVPSDLRRFKDLHKGERCFVMGNGPSLNQTNLSLLDGETVFACNAVFLLFDRIAWRPRYYACVDSRVLPDRAAEIGAMLDENPSMQGFFPTFIQDHAADRRRRATKMIVAPDHNRHFFNEAPNSLDRLPHSMFSYDANDVVIQPFTVAITMLQLAAYMGFSEIILIGCDTNYIVPDTVRREGDGPDKGIALTSSRDDDPNHFDRRYFGKDRKWHDPQPDRMILHYEHAKAALDAIGVRVYNATVGGRLEVFPRRSLESFFEPNRRSPVARAAALEAEAVGQVAPRGPSMIGSGKKQIGVIAAIVKRSPRLAVAVAAALVGLVSLAVLFGDRPGAPYAFMAAGFATLAALIAIVAIRLRGFIVELSRQVLDIANGAVKPPEGAVIGRIEMEDELSRLRDEVERLKAEAKRARDGS